MPTKLQKSFNDLLESEVSASLIFTDSLQTVLTWVESNMEPGEVFTTEQLEKWAEDNGYEKK